jgi:hypothetical protein
MEDYSVDMKSKIEIAEKNLARLLEWVTRFDNKSIIILGVDTGMLGVLASFAPPLKSLSLAVIFVASLSLFFLGLSLLFIYLGSYPRTTGPKHSLLYWGCISQRSFSQYKDSFKDESDEEYLNDLLEQCHRNSEILDKKFTNLKWAYRMLFVALSPWIITIYLFRVHP